MARPPSLRRRPLLGLLAGAVAAALAPRGRARADVGANDRKFLFVFAHGGWDPTWVFAPEYDNTAVDMPGDGSESVSAGGHTWVSSADRPSVDALFADHGDRVCVIDGLVVPSVAHEQCQRLLFTGGSSPGVDDFPTRIARASPSHLALGDVVFSGPSYTAPDASGVVRVGRRGQLAALLDGSCTSGSFPSVHLPDPGFESIESALVATRARRALLAAAADPGRRGAERTLTSAYDAALADAAGIGDLADVLAVTADDPRAQMLAAAALLGSGSVRCVTLADEGYLNATWDQHSNITQQSANYEQLFGNLLAVIETLEATSGTTGGTLLDETTVVVCSEMGRYPSLNGAGGKDHWTTTSLMLIGGGIRGGQHVGDYDANMGGTPVVLETGELDADGALGGVVLEPLHIGATLLALAGLDPVESLGAGAAPIAGAITT